MLRKLTVAAAWATLCLICFVTLSPIGLRPATGAVGTERFCAYFLLGLLFVLAYPGRFLPLIPLIAIAAIGLEVLQYLTPDRHGHFADAMEKVAGGVVGCLVARLALIWIERGLIHRPATMTRKR